MSGPEHRPPAGGAPPLPLPPQRVGFGPAPELLSAEGGILRLPAPGGASTWVVGRHADVKAVLADPVRFSNAAPPPLLAGAADGGRSLTAGNFLTYDPPDHTRLRRTLGGQFTQRRMRTLEPRIREIVATHLDAMAGCGPPVDLVAEFALPVPSMVICELLGVPWADRTEFQQRSAAMLDSSLPEFEQLTAGQELYGYLAGRVARARARPGDELLGMLVREHGAELADGELTGMALLLLVAGHETTAHMLGLGTLALLTHPEQLAVVRDDPGAVPAAVEELLRWLSAVNTGVPRTATTDVELSGVTIGRGDTVFVSLPAADRDPRWIADPDRLDISRGRPGHLAFGHGIHHCLGAPLARMEMTIGFPALLRRFPDLALAVPAEQIEFHAAGSVHGAASLPVTW